jgi:hypothetical protein
MCTSCPIQQQTIVMHCYVYVLEVLLGFQLLSADVTVTNERAGYL